MKPQTNAWATANRAGEIIIASRSSFWKRFIKQRYYQLFVILGMLFLLVFAYTPMFGILMVFKHYTIVDGIAGIFTAPWVGTGQAILRVPILWDLSRAHITE